MARNKNPVVGTAGGGGVGPGVSTQFADGDTTPDVSVGDGFSTLNTGVTVITAFDGGSIEQVIHLQFGDAATRIQNGANIRLRGGLDYPAPGGVSAAFDTLVLRTTDGAVFVEETRSRNS